MNLMPCKSVKAFVSSNKNDVVDARAIWLAVAVKTEAQQAVLALHRMRQQLVKFRTTQSKGLRGLLSEYSEVMPLDVIRIRRQIVEHSWCRAVFELCGRRATGQR